MASFVTLAAYILLAEILRRFLRTLWVAYTGPLSKIPGRWYMRLSVLPWASFAFRGVGMHKATELFDQYGDTVRIGRLSFMENWTGELV
jgi:hypothetical protein